MCMLGPFLGSVDVGIVSRLGRLDWIGMGHRDLLSNLFRVWMKGSLVGSVIDLKIN